MFLYGTTAHGPAPVPLGTSGNYAVLAQTGVSSVPDSSISTWCWSYLLYISLSDAHLCVPAGNVGISPAAGSFLTGFSLTIDSSTTFSTSAQVTGKLYAASYTEPTPTALTAAVSDMQIAYVDGAGRPNVDFTNYASGMYF